MTSDQLTSMYAEIVLGVAKDQSQFQEADGFAPLWDQISNEVDTIRQANPRAEFDIPSEIAG